MVNRLLKPIAEQKPSYKVLARYIGELPEAIGSKLFETGDEGWIPYEYARQNERFWEIIEYEQALVNTLIGKEPWGEPTDLPAFVCLECWEQGVLTAYAKLNQMTGHMGSHKPNHGRPKTPPPPPKRGRPLKKKTKRRTKERDEIE